MMGYKMKYKNNVQFIFLVGISLLLLSNVVSAQTSMSDAGVEYDRGIRSKFLYESKVYVIVTLEDNSGIVYDGTKEERRDQGEIKK